MYIGIRGSNIYANSYKNGLVKLGYEVVEPEYVLWQEQNFALKKIKSLRQSFKEDFFGKQEKLFIECLENEQPDLVFVFNNNRMTSGFAKRCQELGVPMYTVLVDSIHYIRKGVEYKDFYEGIWSYEPNDIKIQFGRGKYIKYLPVGSDTDIYQYNPYVEKKYDLCFVGNLDQHRCEILETVAKYAAENKKKFIVYTSMQLKKFKKPWLVFKLLSRQARFKKKYPYLYDCIINEPIVGKDLVDLYNATRICLNVHAGADPGMHTGPNPRSFEILSCGAFELVNKGNLDNTVLNSGEDLIEFKDNEDLVKQIEFYLEHQKEAMAMAKSGCKKVVDNYTIETILNSVFKNIE